MSKEQVGGLIDMYNEERKENKRLKEEINELYKRERRYIDTIKNDTITIGNLKKQIKELFEDCKIDIEKNGDEMMFQKMQGCLRKLIAFSVYFEEKDLQRGYRIAMCGNIPPKTDEKYFDLIFRKRSD